MKNRRTRRLRSCFLWGIISLVALLCFVRVLAPPFILKKLNNTLATMEGPFCGHLADFDLALIRGAYRLEGFELKRWSEDRKECKKEILSIRATEISLAWGQLFRGKARLRVDAQGPKLQVNEFLDALDRQKNIEAIKDAQAGAKESWDALVPWRIDSVRIREGKANYQLLGQKGITAPLENLEAEATGIETSVASAEPILFRLKGSVFGDSPLLISGSLAMNSPPTRWDLDFNLRGMDLRKANAFLKDRVPMTFTTGNLSLFGEAAGKGARIDGYTRVLFSGIDVVSAQEDWKGFKQGIVEVVSSLFFLATKNKNHQNVGTEIVFRGEPPNLEIDWVGALARSLQHSGGQAVPAGIDNRLELPKP